MCSETLKSRVPSIMICMKNLRLSSRLRAKVMPQGPPGSARAQPGPVKPANNLSVFVNTYSLHVSCKVYVVVIT